MTDKIVSIAEYNRFYHEWATQTPKTQRLGQTFCNKFNITDPELFYETNFGAAIQRILTKYVKDVDE